MRSAGLALCAALAACASAPGGDAGAVRWSCDGQLSIVATPRGDDGLDLTLSDGRSLSLKRAVSGSGVLYEAETHRFGMKGDEAYLAEGEHIINCRRVR